MREEVMTAGTDLRVYPEPAEVFVADQIELAEHLHPLVSIELSAVDPAWHGRIHLLSPVEPVAGYLGDHTEAFHSPLQRSNWLGFAVEDDRYRLLGDRRYFARVTTAEELPDPWPGFRAELDEHCASEQRSYAAHRDAFRRDGVLLMRDDDGALRSDGPNAMALLEQLGGEPDSDGNWVQPDLFDLEDDDEDGVRPVSPAGNPFRFVASVPGWHYRGTGADSILLFFEPVERLALLTFDWS
jgi:hypothetical protein